MNDHIPNSPVKLNNLKNSLCLISPGDFQCMMDLQNCYFHVRVNKAHQQFLGFSWRDPYSGEELFYTFCVMIYGAKSAVSIITRLIKPIVSYLHSSGIKYAIYVDDGRTSASSKELTEEHHQKVLEIFSSAGWNIQRTWLSGLS